MSAQVCCAYLRVYQPLSALSAAELALVERQGAESGPARTNLGPHPLGFLAPEECREVYERTIDDVRFVCVGHTRLRVLLGLVAFERSLPDNAMPAFFPKDVLNKARSELEMLQQDHPDVRPSIVQSAWHVPLRWFACFDDAERRVEQIGDHPTIRYETRVGLAQERVSGALETLTGGIVHPVIVGMIYELKEWLASFHPSSVLELDYASVGTLFEPDVLADDHSAADVWEAIRALGDGDGMRAGMFYQRVNERWNGPRTYESLN